MISMKENLNHKLSKSFNLEFIEIINESHLHNTPPDAESHFKIILVSNDFFDKSPVKRHQAVYSILTDELNQQVHALALHTYTPDEWQQKKYTVPETPDCKGGREK